jgi:phosphotransferase system  glucose/maltose/N-acetylglucosamine-specific IIC component
LFEIILLIAATVGITSLARGRGGNPWLWGTLTIAGYFLVPGLISFLWRLLKPTLTREDAELLFLIIAIAWVAVLAFCARFVLGAKHAKPGGMWSCPHCRYLNQPYAVICEACHEPYGSKQQPAT